MNAKKEESKALWIVVGFTVILCIAGIFMLATSGKNETKQYNRSLIEDGRRNILGAEDAQVVIVEFSHYQCPACEVFNGVLEQAREEYGDQIQISFRHFPFSQETLAYTAALATEAAGAQGKFWELNDLLYERQDEWKAQTQEEFLNTLEMYAQEIEVDDVDTFMTDITNATYAENVQQDLAVVAELELNATPTIFINGTQFEQFSSYEALQEAIDAVLAS